MAAPLSDDRLLAALKAEGCKVREWPGWRNSDRPGPFAPRGVIIHHTGSNSSGNGQAYVGNILWSGYAGLPGPLCTAGGAVDGTLWLLCNNDANHGGGGDPAVLEAVTAEASWLMEREAKPTRGNSNGVDGNAMFYGLEIMYSGGSQMAPAQYDQAVRFAAALCRAHGWSARSVIGHREWSRDKIDPGSCNMVTFRKAVQARLNSKPTKPPINASPGTGAGGGGGTPNTKDGFDMASTDDLRKIVNAPRGDVFAAPFPDKTNPTWSEESYLGGIYRRAFNADKNSAAALALVKQMAQASKPLTAAQTEAVVEKALADYDKENPA